MAERFFITTAIDYTNSAPHIGHAYEKVLADVLARFHRMKREEVFFLTGVDQHGQKVQQSAQREGVEPKQFVDTVTDKFIALWSRLDVKYDRWAATTDDLHKACVRGILQRLFDDGQIYKEKQGGHYSIRQEQFLTDKERNQSGEFGPEWGTTEFREEENYYFRLAQHRDWLLALLDSRSDLILPAFRQKELRNAVEKLSGDLCISRPKSRLDWGIELPFDAGFVSYVWFDALVNYISFVDYRGDELYAQQPPAFRERWPALHVIGKDILIPAHGVYWPIMLHAMGFPDDAIPQFLVHGWWNIAGAKISKSLGNVVDPDALADKYGTEALRYYLMSDIAAGGDSDFSEERLVTRYNIDLANSLGNLLNRSLSMAQRYRDGIIKRASASSPLAALAADLVNDYERMMAAFNVQSAIDRLGVFLTACNAYIETTAPWKLAKTPERASDLDEVLAGLAEALRFAAILISPLMPKSAGAICGQLNWTGELRLDAAKWGALPDGHRLGKPTPLFPRIEAEEAKA